MNHETKYKIFTKLQKILNTPEMYEKIASIVEEYINNNFTDIKDVKLGDKNIYHIKSNISK